MLPRATLFTATALLVTACGAEVGASASALGTTLHADSSAATTGATPVLLEPVGAVEDFRELEAGTYLVDDPFPVRFSFVVPAGWARWAYTDAASQLNVVRRGLGEVSFEIVDNVSADPCTGELLDPPMGPSIDDLVTALSDLDEFEVSAAEDFTLDGFRGKQLTMTAPAEPACESLSTWRTTTRQNGVGAGEVNEVRILDVDGVRLVIAVARRASLTDDALSQIDAVVDSIQLGD